MSRSRCVTVFDHDRFFKLLENMYDEHGYPVKPGGSTNGNVQGGSIPGAAPHPHHSGAPAYERVPLRERSTWNSTVCDCFMDCSVCLEVSLCVCGEQGRVAAVVLNDKQDSVHLPVCLFAFFCFYFDSWVTYYLRSEVVKRYSIDESCGTTLCLGCCLPQCSSCQLHREVLFRGEFPGGCFANDKPNIRPPPPTSQLGYSRI